MTLEFSDAIDLSVAANDVRDAIGRITQNLPDEADAPQIVKADSDSSAIMRLAVTSTNLNMDDLTQLVENEVIDRLASVDGVADVEEYGDQEKVFRVDVDQGALASRGLTIGDLTKALDNAALDAGRLAEEQYAGYRSARHRQPADAGGFFQCHPAGSRPARRRRDGDAWATRRRNGATLQRQAGYRSWHHPPRSRIR